MVAAVILDFAKFQTNGRFSVGSQCASPCQISSKSVKRLQIWRFNGFFKMLAVRQLGFVGRVLGPPTMTNRWSLIILKILLKSMQ